MSSKPPDAFLRKIALWVGVALPLVAVAVVVCFMLPKSVGPADMEATIDRDLRRFYRDIASKDESVRKRAVDRFFPDEALMTELFGAEGKLVWARMKRRVMLLRMNTASVAEKSGGNGALVKIEAEPTKRLRASRATLPAGVQAYEAVLVFEHGASQSGYYVVVGGRTRWVRGLGMACEMARSLRQAKK